jgi:hypothetical protein
MVAFEPSLRVRHSEPAIVSMRSRAVSSDHRPLGSCLSPRPGTITVFLGYFTGDFLMSEGYPPLRDAGICVETLAGTASVQCGARSPG